MTKERLKELAQPILKGMFGKQMPYHLRVASNEDKPPVRPVGTIVEDLCRVPEEAWAKYAFSREPLNGKYTDEQRVALAAQAAECGREWAERLSKEHGTRDPAKLADKMGLTVDYPLMPQNASRVLFAEFIEPDKIFVYMDGVNKGKILLKEPGVREALGARFDIADLLLGHELFHRVELVQKELWTNTYRLELWRLGPVRNHSRVMVLGEIAAMAFTRALCGIPWSPYVMDAYLVYGYSPEAASALYEEMMGFAGLPPSPGVEAAAPLSEPEGKKEP